MHEFNRKLIWDGPFLQGRFDDRDWAIDAFLRHNAAVPGGDTPERLLVFEVSEGWGPLCDFLGVDKPDEEFPRSERPGGVLGAGKQIASPRAPSRPIPRRHEDNEP